jgi:hypothetical protein
LWWEYHEKVLRLPLQQIKKKFNARSDSCKFLTSTRTAFWRISRLTFLCGQSRQVSLLKIQSYTRRRTMNSAARYPRIIDNASSKSHHHQESLGQDSSSCRPIILEQHWNTAWTEIEHSNNE